MSTTTPPPAAAADEREPPTSTEPLAGSSSTNHNGGKSAAAATVTPLPPFRPELYQRAWCSVPHPTLPLLATAHAKSATVFSLATFSKHSALTGGHARSVRAVAWQPQPPSPRGGKRLGLVTGSFDATAGMWSYDVDRVQQQQGQSGGGEVLEREVTFGSGGSDGGRGDNEEEEEEDKEWEFTLVLEGHENEVKSLAFSPGGQYLATCSRDKTVWIWEDVGAGAAGGDDGDDDGGEWETVAVLSEHDGDVKAVAWCPSDLPNARARRQHYSADVLASASYDNTVRIWREDADGEWTCVAVLEGHDGTVWGLQWEGKARADGRFPRLMTCSADGTIRVWSLKEQDDDEVDDRNEDGESNTAAAGDGNRFRSRFGGAGAGVIPNTMRRSLREEWACTAVLPQVHTRDVYSATWSAETGLVASTGSDGIVALYAEDNDGDGDTAAEPEHTEPSGMSSSGSNSNSSSSSRWRVLATVRNAHGPYEVNHVTWCKRFDPGAGERKGQEEMLVTTGDDGVVRPWQVRIS